MGGRERRGKGMEEKGREGKGRKMKKRGKVREGKDGRWRMCHGFWGMDAPADGCINRSLTYLFRSARSCSLDLWLSPMSV